MKRSYRPVYYSCACTHEVVCRDRTANLLDRNRPSTDVYVMTKGRIVYESSPRELWENEEIKRSYLGV